MLLLLSGLVAGLAGCWSSYRSLRVEVLALTSARAGQQGQWAVMAAAAERALQLKPDDYRLVQARAQAEGQLGHPESEYRLLLRAVETRPSWPYAWAPLVAWNFKYGRFPAQRDYSLRAMRLTGPQERGLNTFLAQQALGHANDDLPAAVRISLRRALQAEWRANRSNLMGYALVRGLEPALCAVLEASEGSQAWCEEARFKHRMCEGTSAPDEARRAWCMQVEHIWRSLDYPP